MNEPMKTWFGEYVESGRAYFDYRLYVTVACLVILMLECYGVGLMVGQRERQLGVEASMARITVKEANLLEMEWRLRRSTQDAVESRDRDRDLLEREKRTSRGLRERLDWAYDGMRWMDETIYFQNEAIYGVLQQVKSSCEDPTAGGRHKIPLLVFDKKDRGGRYVMYGRD